MDKGKVQLAKYLLDRLTHPKAETPNGPQHIISDIDRNSLINILKDITKEKKD